MTGAVSKEVRAAAGSLAPMPVSSVVPAGIGANSSVFRVQAGDAAFALKKYPVSDTDLRPRQETEWLALRFMAQHKIRSVPAAIGRSVDGQFILMEWIDGDLVRDHSADDLDALGQFVQSVLRLYNNDGAADFGPASEACLSAGSIIDQIRLRMERYRALPHLGEVIGEHFAPVCDSVVSLWSDAPTAAAIPSDLRRLVPADAGFHNCIRRKGSGELVFFDFDYFGWDDPAKAASDIMLHPAMAISPCKAIHFANAIDSALPHDPSFLDRLGDRLNLFALRWSLIVLRPIADDVCSAGAADELNRRTELAKSIWRKAREIHAALRDESA